MQKPDFLTCWIIHQSEFYIFLSVNVPISYVYSLLLPFFFSLFGFHLYVSAPASAPPHTDKHTPSSITISSCPLFSPSISARHTLPSVTSGEQPLCCTPDWRQAPLHLAESGTHLTEIFVKQQITWLRLLQRAAVAVWRIRNIPPASPSGAEEPRWSYVVEKMMKCCRFLPSTLQNNGSFTFAD